MALVERLAHLVIAEFARSKTNHPDFRIMFAIVAARQGIRLHEDSDKYRDLFIQTREKFLGILGCDRKKQHMWKALSVTYIMDRTI